MLKGLCCLTGLIVLACSTFSTALRAENGTHVYTGTLGKMPIVLEVNTTNGDGRYFYQKYRQDLVLSGTKEGDTLLLDEGDQDEPRSKIRLKAKPDGWSGDWTSPKGKTLKIELQQARMAPVASGTLPYLIRLHDKSPYEYLRLQGLKLKQGQTETFMGYTLQWWSEPQSNIALFEVVSGYSPQALQRINQQLMAHLWQGVVQYFGCTINGAAGSYTQESQPMWMTSNVMSVVTSSEYYCGGAYPDQNNEALNLDTKTGKALTLEDVLWVGQGKPLHFEENYDDDEYSSTLFDPYSEYRSKELAPWLVAQLLKLYPDQMTKTPEGEDDCNYSDEDPWRFSGWEFAENGIRLAPSYPHAAAVCANIGWSVLPYSLIKQHPGGVALQLP
ncbi:hypothetical protein POF45_08655 [Pseudomonas sp. 681]|uniref:Uncharacterized protein n=1 Tax=Pseudomonas fungipugnans TaxID=3024217 RepID=A0ABT6QKT2_9PSED|nr:hypothetical protein [Pseudomonas sp. 681]MDI2591491.1 hypothetical protein [Pseudomonas sp. 681]